MAEVEELSLLARSVHTEDGCLLWMGGVDGGGYGMVQVAPAHNGIVPRKKVHRVAYELWVGPIPDGLQIDHICHNSSDCVGGSSCLHRRCLEPSHLRAVTDRVNKYASPNFMGNRTQCKHGHEFTPETTLVESNGRRKCRTCHNQRRRKVG
jgi:hypothetical protein